MALYPLKLVNIQILALNLGGQIINSLLGLGVGG